MAVELAFAAASLAAAIVLTFSLGPVSHATNQTTAHIVGAALLALACGAVFAALDPRGARAVVWTEIVFTAASAVEIVRKIVVDEGGQARTWLLLGALVVGLTLLLLVAPAAGGSPARGAGPDDEDPAATDRRHGGAA